MILYNNNDKQRIDIFLTEHFATYSRSAWQDYIKLDFIKVNQLSIKPKYQLVFGDKIEIDEDGINLINKPNLQIKCLDIDLDIVFENENLLVINKPAGLTTHPGAGNMNNTLVNALVNKYKLSDCSGLDRLGIVHRLDKDTSGLIIVAKNNIAHVNLAKQIELKTCKRKYLAICYGVFTPSSGNVTTSIAPQKNDHRKMEVTADVGVYGKIAITNYKTLEIFCNGSASLVEFSLETGRTHQIRVHSLHLKRPIIGDKVYVNTKYRYNFENLSTVQRQEILDFGRQALHSYYLEFTEPLKNDLIKLEIGLPKDMLNLTEQLRL